MRLYRVLVVDDHLDTADVLSVLFKMLGHETHAALRGQDALVLARENDFDLILLDLGLPDIDGCDLVRTLRADPRRPGRPERYIAAVTGHCRPADVTRAIQAGFNDHITKPIDLTKIRQILRCADSHYASATPGEASGPRSSPPTPPPAA